MWLTEHWPYLLIAFGGLCAVAGSFAAATKQSQFEAEMRKRASETQTKTEEAIASITGGDSYISLMAIVPPTRERFFVWLQSEGKYTVYDVQFTMDDGTAAADYMQSEIAAGRHPLERDPLLMMTRFKHVQQLGNIPPSTIVKNTFSFTFPPNKTNYGFQYDLKARNGNVKGYLEFVRNAKGLWYVKSHKAWNNGEVIKDVTDDVPDMPTPSPPLSPPQ